VLLSRDADPPAIYWSADNPDRSFGSNVGMSRAATTTKLSEDYSLFARHLLCCSGKSNNWSIGVTLIRPRIATGFWIRCFEVLTHSILNYPITHTQ